MECFPWEGGLSLARRVVVGGKAHSSCDGLSLTLTLTRGAVPGHQVKQLGGLGPGAMLRHSSVHICLSCLPRQTLGCRLSLH